MATAGRLTLRPSRQEATARTKPLPRTRSRREARTRSASLFVLPVAVLLALLVGWPLLVVIGDAFTNVNLVNPTVHGFAGLANFATVFEDDDFLPATFNTIGWTVASVAGEYALGLASAIALNQVVPCIGLFRALVVVPWVVPIVVAGLDWTWMLDPSYGVLNVWAVRLGILSHPVDWLGRIDLALPTITVVNIWRSFPFWTVSLLAAMQAIPQEIREAAALDGAGRWSRFRHVTLPYLRPVTLTLVVLHVIWTAINFDFIWVMTEGGPLDASETLPILLYRDAMQDFDVGAASALATTMLSAIAAGFFVVHYAGVRRRGKAA